MSRIGKLPITLPAGVTVEVRPGGKYFHQEVFVNGPKGALSESLRRGVNVEVNGNEVVVSRTDETKQTRSYHGLYRTLVNNMVQGVAVGYRKDLQIVGIGYRAEMQGTKIVLALGYAHKVEFDAPEGITITVDNLTDVAVTGIDRQLVGEVAAKIRAFRTPEPYKGKGIRYKDEHVRRKSVKKGAA